MSDCLLAAAKEYGVPPRRIVETRLRYGAGSQQTKQARQFRPGKGNLFATGLGRLAGICRPDAPNYHAAGKLFPSAPAINKAINAVGSRLGTLVCGVVGSVVAQSFRCTCYSRTERKYGRDRFMLRGRLVYLTNRQIAHHVVAIDIDPNPLQVGRHRLKELCLYVECVSWRS